MPRLESAVAVAMLAIFLGFLALAAPYSSEARFVPLLVAIPAAALAAWQVTRELAGATDSGDGVGEVSPRRGDGRAVVWLLVFVMLLVGLGFIVGGTLAVMLCQRVWLRESWRATITGGAIAVTMLVVGFEQLLGMILFEGWLVRWIM